MRKLLFTMVTLFIAGIVSAQALNPVTWTFSSKKISDNIYEIQLMATIQQGWHLYSQSQPKDAIIQPTTFTFAKNPFLATEGKVKEIGKMEKFRDEVLDATAYQYSNKVVFIQKIVRKGKAKTAVTGSLEFQTCNDEKCLPPKTVNFSIPL